jgi:anti-sigma regulatory factor (Ser/Thr protein kinase)
MSSGWRCEMRAVLPATLDAVEGFVLQFRSRCQDVEAGDDRFAAELLLRETLTNAVLHGCHGDPARSVRCVLRAKNRRLLMAVEDEGAGFDWHGAWNRAPVQGGSSGRGLEILRRYATRVRFNRHGNAAFVVRQLR